MSSLRHLRIDDNPLVFPPADVYTVDPDGPDGKLPIDKQEQLVTRRVKMFLRSYSARQKPQNDSDGELRYVWLLFLTHLGTR
jgi:hypothetical protein